MKIQKIKNQIYQFRSLNVMLDSDLAEIYGVPVKRLNEQVKRNRKRFPADFMFQLNKKEIENLRSQFATLKTGHGQHSKYKPYVFTELGVAMLSSVLNSETAILANIHIMRTFANMRKVIEGHADILKKIESIENKVSIHDKDLKNVFQAIRELYGLTEKDKKKEIGFK